MDNLRMLKQNLELPNDLRDEYLLTLLDASERDLVRHGIKAPKCEDMAADYQNLVVMYAAYYYRKRAEDKAAMPRMLQYAMHNYLLAQKMEVEQ